MTWSCVWFRLAGVTLALGSFLQAGEEVKPLPDPKILLERIIATAKALKVRRDSYLYLEEAVERKLDRKGLPKQTITRTFEVTMVPNGQVKRLLAENGKPLSEERAKAEDSRILAQLKELEAPLPEPDAKRKAKEGKEIMVTIPDLLAVLDFVKIERTNHKNHPVLMIEFRPRKGASTSGLAQRLASKWEGRLLVEEDTAQVVQAEGRMVESCWVGGGLVGSLAPPSTFHFEQAEVAEGLWMPIRGQFSVFARIVVVPIRMETSFTCSGFRRFEVEESTIGKATLSKAE